MLLQQKQLHVEKLQEGALRDFTWRMKFSESSLMGAM